MVTHQAPGDTFWDIVRTGGETAAARNNIELLYSNDPEGSKQAQLVDQAVDQNVDGIVVSLAKPDALAASLKKAEEAGIPVFSINSGDDVYKDLGALAHFGQNETNAGEAVGEQLNERGGKHAICVIHEQGNIGHESRCGALADTFTGKTEIVYVNGANMPEVVSTITAKLQATAGIDWVVTLGAPFGIAAIDAIAEAGSDAQQATNDLNQEVIDEIEAGTIQFTVDQQPWMQGYQAVEAVRLLNDGGYVLGGGNTVKTGPAVVSKDNLDSVKKQFANQSQDES